MPKLTLEQLRTERDEAEKHYRDHPKSAYLADRIKKLNKLIDKAVMTEAEKVQSVTFQPATQACLF